MSARKSSHSHDLLDRFQRIAFGAIASSLRSTSKKPVCPMTRSLDPPMAHCGQRVRFVAAWREEFFEVPYSVCNCNRIGGFARDDGLPQHLAAVSLGPHFYAGGSLTVHPASTVRLEGNDNDPD